MIKNEYTRFMKYLDDACAPDNVRKLANIVLNHLDDLIPLGTSQGKRSQKIIALAQREMGSTSAQIVVAADAQQTATNSINRLKELKVGPFRGFAKEEVFDLDSRIVLVYGPNGTGKSSFCEALEFGLLGSVQEAESKRLAKANEYLKNAHTNSFSPPVINCLISDSTTKQLLADEASFRFCFVEKNRIDNFSRIAAHAPARQTELISTLFGLDAFNDFVKNFSPNLDSKYIDLIGQKLTELNTKIIAIEGDKQAINSCTSTLETLANEERELADTYKKEIAFSDFVVALGISDNPGEIQQLEKELEKPPPVISGITCSNLLESRSQLEIIIADLQTAGVQLAKSSEAVSFKKLYQAVSELATISSESCPACKTPLADVKTDPFQLATQGLTELEYLSVLEQKRDSLQAQQQTALRTIHEIITKVCPPTPVQATHGIHDLLAFVTTTDSELNLSWWLKLTQTDENGQSGWTDLETRIKDIEQADATISTALQLREQQKERLRELRGLLEKAITITARRKALEDTISKANKNIAEFAETNKALIESVEAEKTVVEQNKDISGAYTKFVELISAYRDSLPELLIADLADCTVELYNAFNRSDAENDQLAKLKLPTSSGERIELSFRNSPDIYFDALHVLSEGHIRCVGLAILLAKNLKENCPLLIFDDPVNAIDDDHRESIRRTLFEDDHFKEKQIILTCHGEEFYKDIQNLLGASVTKQAKKFTFLPKSGDKHIQIDFQSNPRNYVLAAQEHQRKLENRDALAASRRALEVLANKVWSYVSKHGDGNLSIKLRSAKSPIELRNLLEQLKSQLSKPAFNHAGKDSVLLPINKLLGMNGDSREWRYLNKGTHEESDRAEFDRTAVSEIIEALGELDNAFKLAGK